MHQRRKDTKALSQLSEPLWVEIISEEAFTICIVCLFVIVKAEGNPSFISSNGMWTRPWSGMVHQRLSPKFFIEYLTQNVIFHVKSHVTKHEFWGLLILKSQHLMLPNLTWNETWNDTSLKKLGDCKIWIPNSSPMTGLSKYKLWDCLLSTPRPQQHVFYRHSWQTFFVKFANFLY